MNAENDDHSPALWDPADKAARQRRLGHELLSRVHRLLGRQRNFTPRSCVIDVCGWWVLDSSPERLEHGGIHFNDLVWHAPMGLADGLSFTNMSRSSLANIDASMKASLFTNHPSKKMRNYHDRREAR